MLEHLTRNAPTSLLERIAENPRTHSTTLARLASHEDFEVRAAVADNLNTSIKTIWKLARDTHADVRFRVAECYSVPLVVLKVLAEDENPHVAFRAQKTVWRILKEVTELRTA
ncbi:MAG: HEAT repeat protein [bacterium ADurb.Bin425]|nr:MAG: HEAT repeat protein [bacterium ADurb.Bin425]